MPVQVTPGVQPDGRKALNTDLPVAGLAGQSGWPPPVAATGVKGSKAMSFWMPATNSPPESSVTGKLTVAPAVPVAMPTSIDTVPSGVLGNAGRHCTPSAAPI